MKPMIKTYLSDENGEKFFGPGPYRLLLGIEEKGSLRAAAAQMGMAYSKATFILHRAETHLGFHLTSRKTGGRGGGGSVITDEGKELMLKYAEFEKACREQCGKLFEEYFC